MRTAVLVVLLGVLLSAGQAFGQGTQTDDPRGWGFVYAAPGGSAGEETDGRGFLHVGGGGDILFSNGLGMHFDLGYLAPFEYFGEGIGLFSPGLLYAFNRGDKTVPFVNGGYTLFFRSATASGLFFGGGINHWLNDRIGIRIEGRDNVMVECGTHLIEARFGIVFR